MNPDEQHMEDWLNVRNKNKALFDDTGNPMYRFRYESCERLIVKHNK
jgi:hypothetical protein